MKQKVQECQLFYLFIRNKQTSEIEDLMGPIYEESIEKLQNEYFENDPAVEILNEETFKIIYQQDYEANFLDNWADQIFYYLHSKFNDLDLQVTTFAIGENDSVEEMDSQKEYSESTEYEDILLIGRVGILKYDYINSKILLFANIDADATLTSQLALEVFKYCHHVVDFEVSEHYYETEKGEVYNEQDAIDKFYNDNLFVTNLN